MRLVANTNYWDKARGPRLQEVVFRNDISPPRALELVCTTEGEVDIVTEVAPDDAARVERSEHAKLVSIDAMRAVVGIINRDAEGLPLADRRVRRALNLAVDREALVREAMCGRARPLAGLTPPTPLTLAQLFPDRLGPYPHDAARAATLWPAAGGAGSRPLRIATMEKLERVARAVAADLRAALGLDVEVTVYRGEEELRARRRLAEKERPRAWDVFILEQGTQTADAPTLELHRAVVGETGEYRAGPVVPAFEALYAEFTRQTSQVQLALMANRIDRFVYNQDLALFLCAPRALYAVNKHVQFNAYRTTLELAETTVDEGHWSRRNGSGGTAPAQSEPASSGPSATGFHGAGC